MFLNIINILVTVCLVLACALIILVVLMQRPRQEGLGAAFGGGMTDSMWGAQTTNVLQKFTVYLAFVYFALSLVSSLIKARSNAVDADKNHVLEQIESLTPPTPKPIELEKPIVPTPPTTPVPASSAAPIPTPPAAAPTPTPTAAPTPTPP